VNGNNLSMSGWRWNKMCFETDTQIYITLEQSRDIDEDLVKDVDNDCIKKYSTKVTS
jgi:hypothetical protein